jgi:Zn-dependent protease
MKFHSTGPGQGRSFRLAEYFDIELRVHWSFAALAGGLGLWVLAETGSLRAVGAILLPIAMVFTCVVFHEYGHALMARHFGIRTQGITLFPIGGVAVLEREPASPAQELWIAVAGPAVNFVLAGLLLVGLLASKGMPSELLSAPSDASALGWLLRVNLLLGTFNLLPALPMDGGRILRAALALRMSNFAATRIASRVARGIAALMIFFGVTRGQWMLALIGTFVWSTAKAELVRAMVRDALEKRQGGWGTSFGRDATQGGPMQGGPMQGGPMQGGPRTQHAPDGEWIQPPVRPHSRDSD